MKVAPIKYNMSKSRSEMVAMRGINYSDAIQDGDMVDSKNISARRYPYISTRRARRKLEDQASKTTALTSWNELLTVTGTDLVYGDEVVGQVTEGEKQFAALGARIVIWPDKKVFDTSTKTLRQMDAKIVRDHLDGQANFYFEHNLIAVANPPIDVSEVFTVGQSITISGCVGRPANNKTVVIKDIQANKIIVQENTFSTVTEVNDTVTISANIPDMDFICSSGNRLWGVSNKDQTLYVSALGIPEAFSVFEGASTDSYALAIGSSGDFTGICALSDTVLIWKETKLHKILGSYPAEYSMTDYEIEGLKAGCHKSMQVINNALYYMGIHGVYQYSGGLPNLISYNFGEKGFTEGVAGNDGDSYYLSVKEGDDSHLFVYETKPGIWVKEDGIRATDFTRLGEHLYILDDSGSIYEMDIDDERYRAQHKDPEAAAALMGRNSYASINTKAKLVDGYIVFDDAQPATIEEDFTYYNDYSEGMENLEEMEWSITFAPIYESIRGRKVYSKLLFRTELPKGSYMIAEVSFDGGMFKECGKIIGSNANVTPFRVPIARCDKFQMRLKGKGPCSILSILREFAVRSDV